MFFRRCWIRSSLSEVKTTAICLLEPIVVANLLDVGGAVVDAADDERGSWGENFNVALVNNIIVSFGSGILDEGAVDVGVIDPGESALHELRNDVKLAVDVEGVQLGRLHCLIDPLALSLDDLLCVSWGLEFVKASKDTPSASSTGGKVVEF